MKSFLILIVLYGVYADDGKIAYDNYSVYRVIPTTDKQLNVLKQLYKSNSGFAKLWQFENTIYDFWQSPKAKNMSVDIMVPPQQISYFEKFTNDLQMQTEVFIRNVQKLIKESTPTNKPRAFGWTSYYHLTDIYSWMDALAQQYPSKVQVVVAGQSYEGRDIKGIKLSMQPKNKAVFIEAGIHAREWIAPATVTYILNQLVTSTSAIVKNMAKSYDWYFFPIVNPDGYEYTFNFARLWRKTRKPYGPYCVGTDANRNWGYHWMSGGTNNNPCSDTYAGPSPFSEPETKALSKFIDNLQKNLTGYIAFHSYGQYILIPYGDSSKHVDNYEELMDIGTKAAESLEKKYGTEYEVGNVVDLLYVASGCSMDWVKGTYGVPITYTYELPDSGQYGFLFPPSRIIPTGQETLDSLITIFKEAKNRGY